MIILIIHYLKIEIAIKYYEHISDEFRDHFTISKKYSLNIRFKQLNNIFTFHFTIRKQSQ